MNASHHVLGVPSVPPATARVISFVALFLCLLAGTAEAQTYSLVYSTSANRSTPADLDGATVLGDIYAFTSPDTAVDRVLFWLDDTTMTGTPDQTEGTAPFDFKGGGPGGTAAPFDTTDETDGVHTLNVRLELDDGSTVELEASFTIQNTGPPPAALTFSPATVNVNLDPDQSDTASTTLDTNDGGSVTPSVSDDASWLTATLVGTTTPLNVDLDFDSTGLAPGTYNATLTATATGYPDRELPVSLVVNGPSAYSLRLSQLSDRSGDVLLDSQAVSGDIYVFLTPETNVDLALFFLDDPGMLGSPFRSEGTAPYDFNGGLTNAADPYDSNLLADGSHTITAELTFDDATSETVHATFTVVNNAAALEFAPLSVSESLLENQTTSTSVELDTSTGIVVTPSVSDDATWLTATLVDTSTPATVDLDFDSTGLAPGTYNATVTGEATSYLDGVLPVQLVVTEPLVPALTFDPTTVSRALGENETTSVSVDLDTNDGSTATPTLSDDATWLTATLVGSTTPTTVDLDLDSAGLTPGTYNATVTASATGYADLDLTVSLTVNGPSIYSVRMSTSSDRSGDVNLDGQVVAGDIYVFTGPDTDVDQVVFYLDDIGLTGAPHSTENTGPFDYNGGTLTIANPLDTTDLDDGLHTISTRLNLVGGDSEVVHATFTVSNNAPVMTFNPIEVSESLEESQTTSVSVDLGTTDASAATPSVSDDAAWLTATLVGTTTPATVDLDFDTTGLATGTYNATVTASAAGYPDLELPVELIVSDGADLTFNPPSISETVDENQTSTVTVDLETSDGSAATPSVSDDASWLTVTLLDTTTPTAVDLDFDATGLAPGDYTATVTASAAGFEDLDLSVDLTVTVPSAYAVRMSTSADRSGDVNLDGQVVSDDIYVFTGPDTDVDQVIFYLNDPGLGGSPHRTENNAPYDYNGGSPDANPLDTTDLDDGSHTISAQLNFGGGGSEVIHATFNVSNNAPTLTFDPNSVSQSLEENQTASASVDLETTDGSAATPTLTKNASWLTATLADTTTPTTVDLDLDATGLAPGTYNATVTASATGFLDLDLPVELIVTAPPVPELTFDPTSVSESLDENQSTTVSVALDTSNASTATPSVSDDASWLTATLVDATTPTTVDLDLDSTGLTPGVYNATVTASAAGYADLDLAVTLTVNGTTLYSIHSSTNADRSGSSGLSGQTVIGDIYVFTTPDTDVDRVAFYLNDPTLSGAPHRNEGNAPYDYNGGDPTGDANPLDTTTLGDGVHTISAEFLFDDASTQVVHATFTMANDAPPMELSFNPGSVSETLEEEQATSTSVDLDTLDGSTATPSVSDDASWLTATLVGTTTPTTVDLDFDATGLTAGTYNATVTATAAGYPDLELPVELIVTAPAVPELTFNPTSVSESLDEDQTTTVSVNLGTSDASTATPSVSDDASWLTATLVGTTTPTTVDLDLDATGLAPGVYNATVTASAAGYPDQDLPVTLTVNGASLYSLRMSTSADRSGDVNLNGQVVADDIYVFTGPDTDVDQVVFYLDDPGLTGSPHRTENSGPYDYNGGSPNANPLDTTDLDDGSHTISAQLNFFGGGSEVVHATFNVSNETPVLTFNPVSVSQSLDEDQAQTVSVNLDTTDASTATPSLSDDASWLTATLVGTTTPTTVDLDLDATGLAPGTYNATVTATATGYPDVDLPVELIVSAPVLPELTFDPTPVSETLDENQTSTVSVALDTSDASTATPGVSDDATWLTATLVGTTTPTTVDLDFDSTGLTPGVYNATVTATAAGYSDLELPVTLTVDGVVPYAVRSSTNADRSAHNDLDGQTVVGDIYVFTAPDTDVDRVTFYLDDPALAGAPHRSEGTAPFDYNGGDPVGDANPLDTTDLDDGEHTISGEFLFDDGSTQVVHATFTVANEAPPTELSFSPNAVSETVEEEQTASTSVDLDTLDGSTATPSVTDDASWLTATLVGTTTPTTVDLDFDATGLAAGTYNATVTASATGYPDLDLPVELIVTTPAAPALTFNPTSVNESLDANQTSTVSVDLDTSDASTATPSVSDDASWLTATLVGTTTPTTVDLDLDVTGLTPGIYNATVTATATGYPDHELPVTLTVNSASLYSIRVTSNADRSNHANLSGQVAVGDIYVFTAPDTNVDRVLFYLDDPSLAGDPHRDEGTAPYDYNGGDPVGDANPLDTTTLSDGFHTISAEFTFLDASTEVVHATFTVSNNAPILDFSPGVLNIALDPDAQQSFAVDIDTSDGTAADYTLSPNSSWLTVDSTTGTTPAAISVDVDTTGLAFGDYVGEVLATATGYENAILTVHLEVFEGTPKQIHLSWTDDPSTTFTVIWQTSTLDPESTVQYRVAGDTVWLEATGALRTSGTTGTLHEVTVTGLTADTEYEYKLPGDLVESDILTTRTAPAAGAADFDFVYFGDTGIDGRLDGLTTGTQQCLDEIVALDPLLVLAGGDYAYYNTDTRFPTLDDAIDAWFNMIEPIASRAPMMPTYGNHEVFLGEGYDDWADRFAVPAGFDGDRNYSFDVGDVHFISVFAAEDLGGLRPGTITWLEDDMTDAQDNGASWIIPFMHVPPFSDGENHPSSTDLRDALGPVFESYDVDVVLTCHDQSFERTYPITGVPDNITNGSTSLTCYSKSDGITWVKVSPSGKLSNKNSDFSPWLTDPAPSWTAARHNTTHHFSHITVTADGVLTVDTYGIIGDGTPPTIIDTFRYSLDPCPGSLTVDTSDLVLDVVEEESGAADISLDTSDAEIADFTVTSSEAWLTATPTTGSTPDTVTVTADATGRVPGTYFGTLTFTAPTHDPVTVQVTMNVTTDSYLLVYSTSSDRSSAVNLDTASVVDDIYVFTTPDAGVTSVSFYYDNPAATGTPDRTEGTAPYDFKGGTVQNATPFDTTAEDDGAHSLTAMLTLDDASEVTVTANFFITNDAPVLIASPMSLDLSADDGGAPVSVDVDVTTTGPATTFTVDVPTAATWLTVTPTSGDTGDTVTFEADPTGLAIGEHSTTVSVDSPDAGSATVTVCFAVEDNSPPLSFNVGLLTFLADEGGPPAVSQNVDLTAAVDVASAIITIPTEATWLSLDPGSGDTPLSISVTADPAGLAAGSYQTTITASAPGYLDDTLLVNFTVAGYHTIEVSSNPDRSGSVNLSGAVVADDIYVFTQPDDADILSVKFWIDNTDRTGLPHRQESSAPYDLEGGESNGDARPYDSTDLDDGPHTISVEIALDDGSTVIVDSPFNVLNNAPAVAFTPSAHTFNVDAGQTDSLTVTVSATDLSATSFTIDDVNTSWLTITQNNTTTPGTVTIDVDATGLSDGLYLETLVASAVGYVSDTFDVRFIVGDAGLAYFAGDNVADTELDINGQAWEINGSPTYQGRTYLGNDIEGLMMNARMVNAAYDDLDGDIDSSMSPWDPRENTEDFIANMEAYRDHGLLCFNLGMQGGKNPAFDQANADVNPYGASGTQCFDDFYNGDDTPYSQFLVRIGSIIREADDLGMAVELSLFHSGQDQRLDDLDAVYAAVDGTIDWVLDEGWTNVMIEVVNEASHGNWDFSIFDADEVVELLDRVKDRSDGADGAHLPAGRLLVSVSGLGGQRPTDAWMTNSDYVIWHGNGQNVSGTEVDLDYILNRGAWKDDKKPIYTNEQGPDLSVIDPHLDRYCSWGYHARNLYQRLWPDDDADRWTIDLDLDWWNECSDITGISPP